MEKTIVIKPVSKAKFSGISSYTNAVTGIEGAQIGKGGYKTGLSREEEIRFETELNLPKGTLSKSNKEFWSKILNITIPNDKPYYMVINDEDPMDIIKYKVILNRSNIAKDEVELAKNPRFEFYIEDAESKAKAEEVGINYKMEANEAFSKLTGEEKKGILKLYGRKGVSDMSDLVIKTQLFKEVEANPEKFISLVNNPDVKVRIEIEEMLEAGILSKKGQYYVFNNSTNLGEPEVIGNSVDEVVGFFKDYKNQSLKIAAKAATQNKKKDS